MFSEDKFKNDNSVYHKHKSLDNHLFKDFTTTDLYFVKLFIQYFQYIGRPKRDALNIIYTYNLRTFEDLASVCPDFVDYVHLQDALRTYYNYHLEKSGVKLDSETVCEMNKGEFDSAVTAYNTVISKYGSTMEKRNGMLYRHKNTVYIITADGEVTPLEEESTIIIHNPYSANDVLYTLEVLAGTNNTVILGSWGLDLDRTRIRSKDKLLKLYYDTLSLLVDSTDSINSLREFNSDSIFCDSFSVNTRELKRSIPLSLLMSDEDRFILTESLKGSIIEEEILDEREGYSRRFKK